MNFRIAPTPSGPRPHRGSAATYFARHIAGQVPARMARHAHAARRACGRLALALSLTGIAACTTVPPAPASVTALQLPRWVQVHSAKPGQPAQDAILAVQAQDGGATRWSLFDPLGMPQARQILQDGRWRNDGFMRPNGAATELFSAILFAWTPEADLPRVYAGQDWREQPADHDGTTRIMEENCSPRWRVHLGGSAAPDRITIELRDGTRVSVAPLPPPPTSSPAPVGAVPRP